MNLLSTKKTFRSRLVVLVLAFAMTITAIPFSMFQVEAAENNEVTSAEIQVNGEPVIRGFANYHGQSLDSLWSIYHYSDGYFKNDSSKYDEHLATTSTYFALSACEKEHSGWSGLYPANFLKNIGCKNIITEYYTEEATMDTVGAVFGHKTIFSGTNDECILIPVVFKGGNIGAEWAKSLLLGTEGDANGFIEKSKTFMEYLDKYATEQNIELSKAKFWLAGKSEGGTNANMCAKVLSDKYGKENVYAYTFGALAETNADQATAESYSNINNIVNANDMYHLIFPSYLGFRLYGRTKTIAKVKNNPNFDAEEKAMLKQLNIVAEEGDKEDSKYISPKSFKYQNLDLDPDQWALGLIIHIVDMIDKNVFVVDDKPSEGYAEDSNRDLMERFKAVINSREDYVNTIPKEVQEAADTLKVEPHTFQESVVLLMKYFNEEWKADLDQITDNISLGLAGDIAFVRTLAKYLLTGELKDYQLIGKPDYVESYAALIKELWSVLYNDLGLKKILKGNQLDELKRILPIAIYSLSKIETADQNAEHESVGSFVGNYYMFAETDAAEIYLAYMRSEDSWYQNAEDYINMQKFGDKYTASSENRAIETRISGLNGQTLKGTTIELWDNGAKNVLMELKDGKISGGTILNETGDKVKSSVVGTCNEKGEVVELSIFAYNDHHRIYIKTDNESEEKPYQFRVTRYWFKTDARTDQEKIQIYSRIVDKSLKNDSEKVKKAFDNNTATAMHIDLDLYNSQEAIMYLNSTTSKLGKTVKPKVVVKECGTEIDSNIVKVDNFDNWETGCLKDGAGKNLYNGIFSQVKYSMDANAYKDCGGNIKWKDSVNTQSEKNPTQEVYFTYGYNAPNPTLTLQIYGENHDIESGKAKAATCTEDGIKQDYWHCKNCDKYFSNEQCTHEISGGKDSIFIKATGHNLSALISEKPASCTEDGYVQHYECQTCHKNFADSGAVYPIENIAITKTGHNMTYVPAVEATCQHAGNVAFYYCNSCEKRYEDNQGKTPIEDAKIDKKDCSYTETVVDEDYLKSEATCTSPAVYYKSCKWCGEASETETFTNGNALGHDKIHEEATDSTCKVHGTKEYWYCERCKKYYKNSDCTEEYASEADMQKDLVDHVYIEVVDNDYIKEASTSCETASTYWKSCKWCGEASTSDSFEGESSNHEWELTSTTAATCTEDGSNSYECSKCHNTKVETIKATGHDLEKTDAKEATCQEAGNFAYWHCKNCEKYYSDNKAANEIDENSWIISKVDHVYNTKDTSSTYLKKAATCTTAAVYCYKCKWCTEKSEEATYTSGKALGHTMGELIQGQAATCTENGFQTHYHCSVCNKDFYDADGAREAESIVLDKTGHSMTHMAYHAATCTVNGNEEYYYCNNCKKMFEEELGDNQISSAVITKLGHDFSEKATSKDYLKTAATCTESAVYYYKCSRCDASSMIEKTPSTYSDDVKGPLGHDLKHFEAVPATEKVDGNYEYWKCSRCNKYFKDEDGETEYEENGWIDPKTGGSDEPDKPVDPDKPDPVRPDPVWPYPVGPTEPDKPKSDIVITKDDEGINVLFDEDTITQKDGEAVLEMTSAMEKEILSSIENGVAKITFELVFEPEGELKGVIAHIPNSIIKKLAELDVALELDTPNSVVKLDNKSVKAVYEQVGGNKVKLGIIKNTDNDTASYTEYDINIGYDEDKKVTKFNDGKIEITLPVPENLVSSTNIKVANINGKYAYDMKAEFGTMGKDIKAANFETTHLSVYAVATTSKVNKLVKKSIAASTVGTPSLKSKSRKITATWKQGKGNTPNKYYVYRSTKKKSGYKKVATVKSTTYKASKKLTKGKRYYYKVVGAVKLDGKYYKTKASAVKSIKCK